MASAQRSAVAQATPRRKRTPCNLPVQSYRDWLRNLATIVKLQIQPKLKSLPPFTKITRPTPAQQRALELLGVSL